MHPHGGPQRLQEGIRVSGTRVTSICQSFDSLSIESGSSTRAASAFNHQATTLAHEQPFF